MSGKVAAGLLDVACAVGERLGVARSELLYMAGLEPEDLHDPSRRISSDAAFAIMRHILECTGDRSLGIRFAEAMDLRTQGFWGYLFLSCLSVRQAAELLTRFQRLRTTSSLSFRVEADWAVFEPRAAVAIPQELEPIFGDAYLASFCLHRQHWVPQGHGAMRAWLTYPEEPHHRELRGLVGGTLTFGAPLNRLAIPVEELDLPLRGADPHLLQLARAQLERQLADMDDEDAAHRGGLIEQVRSRLMARLQDGTSIEHVARELHLSVRTLRRRLDQLGISFQRLLEELRQRRAIEYLTQTDEGIGSIAARLGYGDPSNFRRAFRRWTGQPPAAYRAAHGRGASRPTSRGGSTPTT
jgi:AraC-like DNA-binding protein